MKFQEDRDGARRKLKVIARHLPVFTIADCYNFKRSYFGKHHSDDWRECANEMVSEGKLYTDGAGRYSAHPF